jgi:hypothetical protein
MNSTVKTTIIAIASAVIAIVGYSQVNNYLEHQREIATQREDIVKSVSENTAAVSELLELEIKPNSMTFAELFDQGDTRVKKVSDAIISVSTSPLPPDEKQAIKNYYEGLQETIRLQIAMYRKALAASTSIDLLKQARENLIDCTYSCSFEVKRAQDAVSEQEKAIDEWDDAKRAFNKQLISLKKIETSLKPKLPNYNLVEEKLLTSVIQKNNTKSSK